ncbi:hypothetical protein BU15DRAFT_75939 [Melanogaster broomeanus]|nr:hypothetical protein BU15DRAFT_75939 [Melanogaster broomeanus]
MPRILQDPSLEAEVDFESEPFRTLREIIILNDPTKDHHSAAEQLADPHRLDRTLRLTAWQDQVDEDERLAAEALRLQNEQEELERTRKQAEEEAEKKERDKKIPKIGTFNSLTMVPDTLLHRPSQFALQAIKNFEFVELWYFTPEGCSITSSENKSTASGAYTFAEDGPFLSLKSTASCRASPRALHDRDLSWRQFDLGKNNFLLHIAKANWPN